MRHAGLVEFRVRLAFVGFRVQVGVVDYGRGFTSCTVAKSPRTDPNSNSREFYLQSFTLESLTT